MVLRDADYSAYYFEREAFKILDNSAVESGAESVKWANLVCAVSMVRPNVVVLPDVMFDAEETMRRTLEVLDSPMLKVLKRLFNVELLAVVQGSTPDIWLHCFEVFNSDERIDYLGVPMLTTELFGRRSKALKAIEKSVRKPCHLFGTWYSTPLRDVVEEAKYDFVMGVDSSKPIRLALEGRRIDDDGAVVDKHDKEYFYRKYDVDEDLLRYNCETFRRWCGAQK